MVPKIKWTVIVTKVEVLNRGDENNSILNTVFRRRAICTGYILRQNCLLHDVIEKFGSNSESWRKKNSVVKTISKQKGNTGY